jgi:hypothetical protein
MIYSTRPYMTKLNISLERAYSWRHQIIGRPKKKRKHEAFRQWHRWNLDWQELADAARVCLVKRVAERSRGKRANK